MEIVIDIDNIPNILNLDKNIIFFGKNSSYKNKVINNINDCLLGESKNILINGNTYNSKDFNIISINEENDFTNEF